eukprot:9488632-Pyramimonas_sp.AAC.1
MSQAHEIREAREALFKLMGGEPSFIKSDTDPLSILRAVAGGAVRLRFRARGLPPPKVLSTL